MRPAGSTNRRPSSLFRHQPALTRLHGGAMVVLVQPEVGQGLRSPRARRTAPQRRHEASGLTCRPPRGAGAEDEVQERMDKWLSTAQKLGYELKHDLLRSGPNQILLKRAGKSREYQRAGTS